MLFPKETGRKGGNAWKIQAPAKLNLFLKVLGRRADGFHALETLMVPVRIYDQLSYHSNQANPLTLRIRDSRLGFKQVEESLGRNEDNLVLRAAQMLAESAGIAATGHFDLVKRIPVQAGMGGGSSDAAAALLLANEAWQLGYSRQQLMPIAAQLGSDVPFFLESGGAVCRGRGEIVEPIGHMPRLHFVIAKPPVGLSTPEVFGQLSSDWQTAGENRDASPNELAALVTALKRGSLAEAACKMNNCLEAAASTLAPWLVRLRKLFSQVGCLACFMTGSGSAFVGVMQSARQARRAAGWLRNLDSRVGINVGQVFATSSC